MAAQLTATRTSYTSAEVAQAIAAAWPSIVGGAPPSDTTLTILTAQSALETGFWVNCWNNNVGNIAGTGGDYVMLHAYTGAYRPYRAFPTLQAGVTAYLTLLHGRYNAALTAAINGDLEGFVTNLKAKGYFEENANDYYDGILSRYNTVAAQLNGAPQPGPVPWVPRTSAFASLAKALVGGLAIGGVAYVAHREWEARPALRRRVLRYA